MFFPHLRAVFPSRLGLFFGVLLAASTWTLFPFQGHAQDPATNSTPVFVSDFELAAIAAIPPPVSATPDPSKKPPPKDAPPAVFEASDIPSIQARRLTDFFGITLVQSLQKAGFTVSRQQPDSSSGKGVLLRGVFAEADARNRIRRAMLGGGAPGARLLLYVGTFNLARPEQPLYQPADVQNPDARYGPVITLNNYIPLARFEMPKNPTEDDVRKICTQIAQNLGTLLKTNPSALSQ
jgi:hypothetical protein